MIHCKNKDILLKNAPELTIKDDKVVYKMYNGDTFIRSFITPTDKYPLNNDDDIRIFCEFNTDELTDRHILDLFDEIPVFIGHCYSNSELLHKVLTDNGCLAKLYAGWLVRDLETPVHHCWVVYEDKKKTHVLDLSNNLFAFYRYIKGNNIPLSSDMREVFVNFTEETKNWKNSEKCEPVGVAVNHIYIGCEISTADEARDIYNALLSRYPDHEIANNVDEKGRNKLQKMLAEKQLL